jgi:cell pole-organizing protein PopZ
MQDPDWVDAAEAEVRAALEDSATESVFVRFDDLDSHDERPFDEEMLRDLVRDIIREELQGALGERITRNVRKLVRAEIARALAVRDFE